MDLDALDPNWELAEKHGIASLPGLPIQKDQIQLDFCSCCMNQVCKQDVPLCQNSKTLQFLGYGFPLYFIFIKFSIILIFMLFITYTCIGIFWAYQANWSFCVGAQPRTLTSGAVVECTGWMVMVARVEMNVSSDQTFIRITSFVVTLFILVYMRDILRKTNQYYDEKEISPADFSILVQNLPKVKGIAQKMKCFLKNKNVFRKQYEVQSIVFISSLDKYFQLKHRKKQLLEELKSLLQLEEKSQCKQIYFQKQRQIERSIQETKIDLLKQEQKETQLMKKDQALCEKLILIINTEQAKQEIMQDVQSVNEEELIKAFGDNSSQIKFKDAPQPKQILWQNINHSKSDQVKKLFISWTIYLLILAIVTIAFFYLLSVKSQQVEDSTHDANSTLKIDFLVYLSLFTILIFNKFVLSHVSHKLTHYQMQKTGGQLQFSFALKQILGLFFTTALMTLLVEDIQFNNIYTHKYGVVEEETIMFFMNGIIAPLIWIINPWHIYKTLKQKYYYGSKLITQEEANKIMELTHYSIGKRYAQIIEGIWFTFLYASLIPLGSCFNLFGMVMFYWIDKYNLIRKSSVLENVSSDICLQAMTFLDFILILKPLGQIIFDSQLRNSQSLTSVICLIVGVIYMFLPINYILDMFHSQHFDLADQTYSQTKERFLFDYKSLHPLKYCLQQQVQDAVLQKDSQQFEQTKAIIEKKMGKNPTIFKKEILVIKDQRHNSIHSLAESRDSCDSINSANSMIRGMRIRLPPLKKAKRWSFNIGYL